MSKVRKHLRVLWSDMVRSLLFFQLISPPDLIPAYSQEAVSKLKNEETIVVMRKYKPLIGKTGVAHHMEKVV